MNLSPPKNILQNDVTGCAIFILNKLEYLAVTSQIMNN